MRLTDEALELLTDRLELQASRFVSDVKSGSTNEVIVKKDVEQIITMTGKRKTRADEVKRFLPSFLSFTISQSAILVVPVGLTWLPVALGVVVTSVLAILAIGPGPMANRRR